VLQCQVFVSLSASTSPDVLAAHKAEIWSCLDDKTKAVYGKAYLELLYANFEASVQTYPADVSPVVTAVRAALFSRHVKSRYAVGQGTCTLMYLLMLLPCWMSDRLSVAMNVVSLDAYPAALQRQQCAASSVM